MQSNKIIITLSGIDGAGKTTLANELQRDMFHKGVAVTQLEFPISQYWQLLMLLKKKGEFYKNYGTNQKEIGFLLNMERFHHLNNVIKTQYEIYDVVILQRYLLDFAAIGRTYMVENSELYLLQDIESVLQLNTKMFFIDVPEKIAYSRIKKRGRTDDIRENKEFHEKLAVSYEQLIQENVFDIHMLNGELSPKELCSVIQNEISLC